MNTDSYNSSVVEANGVIYGIEGRGGGSAAIKAGGKGDVTESNTVWNGNDSARFGTPLVYQGRLYYFANGIANCVDVEDGSSIFKGRLPGANESRGDRGGAEGQRGGGRGGFSGGGGQGGFRGGFGGGRRGGFGSADYSSPVAANGKVYYVKGDGTTIVLKAGESFQQLASNKVTDEREVFSASPAISDGQIFLRSDKHLYCVAAE